MATERLQVILEMAAGQYKREAREAATATGTISREAKQASTATGGLQSRMVGFGSVMKSAAVLGGVTAIGQGLLTAVDAAERASSAVANTEQIIRQTGGSANVTGDDISELTRRLGALSGAGDDAVREGANVLLTFKNLKNEVGEGNNAFDRAVGLMLDVSAVMGTDTTSAALQLGKALNDPVSQMGALSRAGLTFSKEQQQMIKDMAANNNLLGAQTLLLDELESQLGGTAAASADASDKIGDAFGEIVEAGGTVLLPILEDVSTELQTIVGLTDELDRVAAHAGAAAETAATFLSVVQEQTGGAGFVSGVGSAIVEFHTFLIPGISRMEEFRAKLEALVPRLTTEELRRARDGVEDMGAQMGLTSSEIELVSDVLETELSKNLYATRDAAMLARDEIHQVGEASGSSAGEFEVLSGRVRDQATAWEDIVTSMEDYETMLARLTDPVFKVIDDQARLADAQAAYNEKVAEYGEDSPEAIEAGFELARAQLAVNTSLQDLPGNLQASIDHIIILGDEAGASRDTLSGMRDILNDLNGLKVDIEVAINRTGAPIDPSTIIGAETGSIPVRHSGGHGRAGQPYIVRPDEEIFVPARDGGFHLNSEVLSALRNLSGDRQVNYTIPITSSGDPNTDAQLVGAVHSVLRRMETL